MTIVTTQSTGELLHIVTLRCKDPDHAQQCLLALASSGKTDAFAYGCLSYEFGLQQGQEDTVYLLERWENWADLDALLSEKVVPALPHYNRLLRAPFDASRDTLRVRLN